MSVAAEAIPRLLLHSILMPDLPFPHASERCKPALRWCVHALLTAAAACALVAAHPARAEICKYQDKEGKTYYTNVAPERGWKRLSCSESGDDVSASKKGASSGGSAVRSPTPEGFPKVDAKTQKGRDDGRRKVLSDELAIEEKLLVETRKVYADGAPAPLPDEKNDTEKYRDRIAKLRQTVLVHERNVEALKKELASVK